jgi:hypothetical protein
VRKFGAIRCLFIFVCIYLVLLASFCFFFKIINFIAFQTCMCVQWLSIGVLLLKKPSTEILNDLLFK